MFLDIQQLSDLLGISIGTIRRRIVNDRDFPPPVRTGKLLRWRRAAIAQWAERSERRSRRQVKP